MKVEWLFFVYEEVSFMDTEDIAELASKAVYLLLMWGLSDD